MTLRSTTTMGGGRLFRLTAIPIVIAVLNGCVSAAVIEEVSTREEPPKVGKEFILTTDENAYTISRWWGTDHVALKIPRSDLPEDCKAARFFLNDLEHELRIAEPVNSDWVTEGHPPLPDDSYPNCSLLVSYGSFSGPPALEGVAVTSSAGLIAKDNRLKPKPSAWALYPFAAMAEGYAIVGSIWTLPIWGPIVYMSESSEERKEKEKNVLPSPVVSCWTAIDDEIMKDAFSDLDITFVGFEWSSKIENAYVLKTVSELFCEDKPVPVDSRVTLHKGRVKLRELWTDADVECGLQSGNVVAIRVELLR